MSKKAETVAFMIWALVVLVVAGTILHSNLKTRTYSGSEVVFTASSGWCVDVSAADPVRIEAADSKYFRFIQGKTDMPGVPELSGVPETPPLDYAGDAYFRLQAQLEGGRWQVIEGSSSISIKLTGEEPFSVTSSPTVSQVTMFTVLVMIPTVIVWVLGLIVGRALLKWLFHSRNGSSQGAKRVSE